MFAEQLKGTGGRDMGKGLMPLRSSTFGRFQDGALAPEGNTYT